MALMFLFNILQKLLLTEVAYLLIC